ncbi:MAG: hypothetical protein QOC55_1544 [Thermoleophilaceae bacterium]|nr:hypothetical protein [Thermoleophilaceae bacterium]
MRHSTITRVAAEADLQEPEGALERAREHNSSDPEWNEFVAQVNAGDILPARFHVSVDAIDDAGDDFTVDRINEDVWLDTATHLPELAENVRETASKDFGELSADLRERGVDVTAQALADMYVEVTLEQSLVDAATRSSSAALAD